MTNTQRATTVHRDSADSFAPSETPETTISGGAAKPLLSSASASSRQGTRRGSQRFDQSIQLDARHVPPPQTCQEIIRSRPSVALVDNETAHAATLADRLRAHQFALTTHRTPAEALQALHRKPSAWDIVVVNVSDSSQPWLAILRRLLEASGNHCSPHTPLFLCTSRIKRDPQFQLTLERLGVRFVYER